MLLIRTNIMTGTRKCEFEHNNHTYYAFQPADGAFTTIYTGNSNVMIGTWVKHYQETKIKDAIDMFTMQPNNYNEVSTYGGVTLPADVKTMSDYKAYWKEQKELTGSVNPV